MKDEVNMLLREGREDELAERVAGDARALRPLVGRLWDPDAQIRARAARAIGVGASAHRELGRDLARRFVWALNDESATNGVYVIPALGEMGRRDPELMRPFVGPMVGVAWDDGLRLEVIRALRAIGATAPELAAEHLDDLLAHVDESREDERHAVGELRARLGGNEH
jgi:HEAT repeat protein